MKARPILFSTPMVLALLDGSKTQTRRAIKGAPNDAGCGLASNPFNGGRYAPTSALFFEGSTPNSPSMGGPIRCPYGRPGDQLWVRETTRVLGWGHLGEVDVQYAADGAVMERQIPLEGADRFAWERFNERMVEKAEALGAVYGNDNSVQIPDGSQFPLTPSIFMPRWASRLTLEITDVRVQRLQEISETDAQAEGAVPQFVIDLASFVARRLPPSTYRNGFKSIWRDINGRESWDENPWVWAVSFEQVPQ